MNPPEGASLSSGPPWRFAVGPIVLLVVWLTLSLLFAVRQQIWVDETTQLSGIHLNPIEVVPWLAGEDSMRFGVPGDRMPPLSYWIGWAWAKVFGSSELALRILGILLVAVGVCLIFEAARRHWGAAAGWVAGLAFVLSPNVVAMGVEIRAYPLFLLCSSAVFYFFLELVRDGGEPRRLRSWIGVIASCVLSMYAHFYGVVLTGAVFVTLLGVAIRRRWGIRSWLIGAGAVAIAGLGLLPFIFASAGMNEGAAGAGFDIRGFVRFAYRGLVGHPSLGVYAPFLIAGMAGFAVVGVAALFPKETSTASSWLLLAAIGAGSVVVMCAVLVVSRFDPLSASYNLWRVPALCLAVGSAMALRDSRWRKVAWGGAALMLIGSGGASLTLLAHGEAFAHTPHRRLIEALRTEGAPASVAVVHDGAQKWGHAYFPLHFTFGSDLRQYIVVHPDGEAPRLQALPDLTPDVDPREIPVRRLLLIGCRPEGADATRRYIRSGETVPVIGERTLRVLLEAGWREEKRKMAMAGISADLVWLTRD